MFILLVFVLSLIVALRLRGGQLSAVLQLRLRYLWLFFIPLLLQLLVFTPLGRSLGDLSTVTRYVYLASMALAAIVLALNRHVPGFAWVAAGLTLNLLVLSLNGGFMPVSPEARQIAGMLPLAGRANNVVPMGPDTLLPWLGDILPLPAWMPLANVISIGDVLIGIGGLVFSQVALTRPAAPPALETKSQVMH